MGFSSAKETPKRGQEGLSRKSGTNPCKFDLK